MRGLGLGTVPNIPSATIRTVAVHRLPRLSLSLSLFVYLLQSELNRLQAEYDELRSSHTEATARGEVLTALQAKYDAAAAQLSALEGADALAAQFTAENDKLRDRLEKTEGQV